MHLSPQRDVSSGMGLRALCRRGIIINRSQQKSDTGQQLAKPKTELKVEPVARVSPS